MLTSLFVVYLHTSESYGHLRKQQYCYCSCQKT